MPSDRACVDFIWVVPSPLQNDSFLLLLLLPRAAQGNHVGPSCHLGVSCLQAPVRSPCHTVPTGQGSTGTCPALSKPCPKALAPRT